MMLDDVEGKKLPDMEKWLEEFKGKLIALFGKRLVLFGIQGSYGREEQTANSDIDVVVIIDDLTFKDIQSYRDMLDTMEYRELICGFVAGKKELLRWEKSDLLQLYLDTKTILGSMECLKNMFTNHDVRHAVLTGASALYHACLHNFLHSRDRYILRNLYKTARFTVRMKHYLDSGSYVSSMRCLERILTSVELEILKTAEIMDGNEDDETFEAYSKMLMEWTGEVIRQDGDRIYKIRTLSENDIPEIRELFRSTVLNVNNRHYTQEEVEDWVSCGDSEWHLRELLATNHYIAALDGVGNIIGFSSMNEDGYLHSLFVHKDRQGRGVASLLLSEVEKMAAEYGVSEIRSEVSITARPFFEHKGYEVLKAQKQRANRLLLTNFLMRKRL